MEQKKGRLTRAIRRILARPRHAGALSLDSINAMEADLKRVVRHAIKLGWLDPAIDPKEQKSEAKKTESKK